MKYTTDAAEDGGKIRVEVFEQTNYNIAIAFG